MGDDIKKDLLVVIGLAIASAVMLNILNVQLLANQGSFLFPLDSKVRITFHLFIYDVIIVGGFFLLIILLAQRSRKHKQITPSES